ncbi:hypothetical protein [Paraburkholderia kururiensis]|uniref:hypothetical protein n=1 Tax=Paraburkholderia kururiensis TaxID=984307 RepID=UPI0005AACB63|nr:hypothetical protein [Paraburkholderia kururiensis]
MKKAKTVVKVIAAAALCCAGTARAESWFQFDGGPALTSATKVGDGIYYSRGFSHDTPNGSYGFRAGIQFNAIEPDHWIPGVRAHLAYYNFGKVRWSSMNPQDSGDFTSEGKVGGYNSVTLSCNDSNCGTFRRFDSVGGIQAIALTVEPYWDVGGGWQIGVEAGPALYRSVWTSVATAMSDGKFGPAGTQETLTHTPRIQAGALAGVSVSRGAYSARLNYLYAPAKFNENGRDVPSGLKGEWMLSLNYTW